MQQQLQYPWEPHKTLYPARAQAPQYLPTMECNTEEEAKELLKDVFEYFVDQTSTPQINDVIYLGIQNALNHTNNAQTNALATSRIPSGADHNNTLRFLIALMYEKQLAYPKIVNAFKINYYPTYHKPYHPIYDQDEWLNEIASWHTRANKIVEIMEDASDKVGTELANNADFIRSAALIDLGEKTGIELTSKANKISFNIGETSDQGNTISRTLAANSSFLMEKASDFRVAGTRVNNTDTLDIVSKNGPNEITVTTNNVPVKSALAKDAKKTLVNAELMGSVVSTQPILLPVATRELPDIGDLEVAEVQSVNLIGLFTGLRVNVTASSADENIATVAVNENTTSMGVTGVAIGTTKITVTGTNEAGAVSADFDLTIIAASD